MKKKRSQIVRMTNEARVLKQLRLSIGISMREAGFQIGKSDTYISHLENGRMDITHGEDFLALLSIYKIELKGFNERVRKYKDKTPKLDILSSLLNKLDESNINVLIGLTEEFLINQTSSGRKVS